MIECRAGSDGVLDEAGSAELVATCAGRDADAIAATIEEAARALAGGPAQATTSPCSCSGWQTDASRGKFKVAAPDG